MHKHVVWCGVGVCPFRCMNAPSSSDKWFANMPFAMHFLLLFSIGFGKQLLVSCHLMKRQIWSLDYRNYRIVGSDYWCILIAQETGRRCPSATAACRLTAVDNGWWSTTCGFTDGGEAMSGYLCCPCRAKGVVFASLFGIGPTAMPSFAFLLVSAVAMSPFLCLVLYLLPFTSSITATPNGPPAPTGYASRYKLPSSSTAFKGVAYSAFLHEGPEPDGHHEPLLAANIDRDMAILEQHNIKWIRTYATDLNGSLIPSIAKDHGIDTVVGTWVNAGPDGVDFWRSEMDRVEEVFRNDDRLVCAIALGS